MSTTRLEIEQQISLLLKEDFHSDGGGDPLTLRNLVIGSTNRLARATDAFYIDAATTGIVSGQGRYCFDEMYRVVSVLVTLADGSKQQMTQRDIGWMDRHRPNWREAPESGDPSEWAYAEPNLYLYEVPDYAAATGLVLSGWGVPGKYWNYVSGVPQEPANGDIFPLPDRAVDAVIYDACHRRCLQNLDNPRHAAQLPEFARIAREERGRLEAEVARQYDRASAGSGLVYRLYV